MPTVCRNFAAFFFIPWPLQGLNVTLPACSLPQRRLCQVLNVVHHTVQIPLGVDLDARAGVGYETAVGHLEGLILWGQSRCKAVDIGVISYVIYSR